MNRIYLVGYMGAGKSSIARKLANRIAWSSCDMDVLFEEKFKISVDDFFGKYGETAFRKLESELLKETSSLDNTVVATGGGTPCFYDNMDWMNKNGITVFIEISPLTSVHRLMKSKKKRPLTFGKTETELIEYVKQHYGSRLPFYQSAQLTVKGESCNIDDVVEDVRTVLKQSELD